MPLIRVADLTRSQKSIVESVPRGIKYLEGPAGSGKTTTGVRRMLRLLTKDKVFANEILVILPQRALSFPYQEALDEANLDAGGRVTLSTLGALARSTVDLFWPLVADRFGQPNQPPIFLSLETAQYYMTRVAGPVIKEKAYFDTVQILPNRLYSQIIDNLNKAAVVGFPHTEIGERLALAWGEKDESQLRIYEEAQLCASLFRDYCVANNLLDFSLQVELFRDLWAMPVVRGHLVGKYRHLIIDNAEEDTPVTHAILRDWAAECESMLIILDTQAGYRRFLGADPRSAATLRDLASTPNRDTFIFEDVFDIDPSLQAFGAELARSLHQPVPAVPAANPREALGGMIDAHRYQPQLLNAIADEIAALVHERRVDPGEIVVLAPFLSDSLRFTLSNRLRAAGVPTRSHRPSRALREEPAAQTLLTLAQLAHPNWNDPPGKYDLMYALTLSVDEMDLVRAQIVAEKLYKNGRLHAFEALNAGIQERITYRLGERLEVLRGWLDTYTDDDPDELDVFFSRLFGEVLSQPGFGFHNEDDYQNAEVAANLIDSARKFRQSVPTAPDNQPLAQEYVAMVREGVIADQYLRSWETDAQDAVLLAPAYTFLMGNRPVDYQFWLNIGSSGWWERLYQPLTHPYVLTKGWDPEKVGHTWTDTHEVESRNETLYHITLGLTRRCRIGIYLGYSQLGEQGDEQRGPLLGAIQGMMRRLGSESYA